MFKRSMLFFALSMAGMGGYRSEAGDDGAGAGGQGTGAEGAGAAKGDFSPSEVNQGVGLFDKAKELEKAQEEEGGPEKKSEEGEGKGTDDQGKKDETEDGKTQAGDDKLTYNGVEVTVTNDPEVVKMFAEQKEKLGDVTVDSVNKELFSEKGLTDATRQKLYDAFGKGAVDMYLKGWKMNNDAAIAQGEVFDAQYKSMADTATDGKLDSVLKWANDNLKPAEYQDYANMVNGGDLKVARMALADMYRRSGLKESGAAKKEPSARETGLKPSGLGADGVDTSPVTAQQYRDALTSREYYKDPKGWDARRRAGQNQGI